VNGAAVATWYDINPQLSYSSDVSQEDSTAAEPSYNQNAINGLPALSFDGSDDYLDSSDVTLATGGELSLFVVAQRISKPEANRGFMSMWDDNLSGGDHCCRFYIDFR